MQPYELQNLWNEIQLSFDDGTFETPEAQARIARFMAEGPEAIDQWVEAIKMAEFEVAGYADRSARLASKKASKQASIERMRENLRVFIESSFGGKLKRPEWTLSDSVRKTTDYSLRNGHAFTELPEDCYRVEYKLVEANIKRRIEAGEDLPIDVHTETKHSLMIR